MPWSIFQVRHAIMNAMTKTIGTSAAWNACTAALLPSLMSPRPARNACTVPIAASANGHPVRAPVRPRADERSDECQNIEEVHELAEILVGAQPTGLTEDVAPDEVDLHQHAHHSERGKGERSPETELLSIHADDPMA